MNTICKSFNDCSADIKNWLTKQPEVKEESLTDRFLFELSEKIPTLKYKQFSRTEEGRKTCADWEWWFVFPDNKSFAARVQAKKLKSSVDNYPGIAYTSNGRLQIERLLEDSVNDGFASFYAFYSTESAKRTLCGGRLVVEGIRDEENIWLGGKTISGGGKNGEGVYFGEANKLRNEFILKSRRTLTPKDILNFTNPVSCLFCCPMTFGGNDIEGFRRHIQEYFPTISNNIKENSNQQELGFRETPNYVLQLLSGDIADWWETEYRSRFERTNAIIVIDFRNNK